MPIRQFVKGVYAFLSFLTLSWLVACVPSEESVTATATSQPTNDVTDMTATSTHVPTATPTTIIPQTPGPFTMSNEVEGWYLYRNRTHGYRISYPPAASITLVSDDCLYTELYESGYLLITAVSATDLPPACQPAQASEATLEMIRLAGQTVMADKQAGPVYQVSLPNGLHIEHGLLSHVDPDAVDSQAALAVIGDMVDSIRFTGEVALARVTPTPIPSGCLDDTPVVNEPPAGLLRVVYEADGQTWEWREETGMALESGVAAMDGKLSTDGRFRVSLRRPDEDNFELWLSAADGSDPRQLIAISPDEVYERYPEAARVRLFYHWVGNTSLISYRFVPEFDAMFEAPVQTVRVVDVETSRSWTVLPPDIALTYGFSADGRHLITLTQTGVQVIDAMNGAVRFNIPLDISAPYSQGINFTPDGGQVYVYTAGGITFINPEDGTFAEIPLDYVPIGMGHYSVLPPVYWLENETQFYAVTFAEDWGSPKATFTIWLVDTAVPTATPLNTFTGFLMSVAVSPDRRWVAFWPQSMDNRRRLHLANIITGEQFLYDELLSLEFIGWSPDGTQFLYKAFESTQPVLGHICAGPRPLTGVEVSSINQNVSGVVKWVDNQRLLILEGSPESDQMRSLRLVTLDGQSTLVATLRGEYPTFRFYFEE